MSPNLVAALVSVLLGVAIIPWSITMRALGSAGYLIVLGSSYLVAGTVQMLVQQPKMTANGVRWALLTAAFYVPAIMGCNYIFGGAKTLPVPTAITAWFVFRQRLSGWELFFFLLTIIGVVGLGLSGKR